MKYKLEISDLFPPLLYRAIKKWNWRFSNKAERLEPKPSTGLDLFGGKQVRLDGQIHQAHAPASVVEIGDHCWVSGSIYMATNSARLVIGCRSFVGPFASFTCSHEIRIGDNVLIAQQAIIADTDNHSIYFEQRKNDLMQWREYKHDWSSHPSAPVIIEDGAWIGARCMILKGVTIGARAVIGAGSVVTKSIPADVIAAGNPARVIRKIAQ